MAAPPSLLGQPKAVWRQPPLSGVLTPVRADGLGARSIDCGARAWQRGVKAALHRPRLEPSASLCGAGMRLWLVLRFSSTRLDGPEEVSTAGLDRQNLLPRCEHLQRQGYKGAISEGVTHARQSFACYVSSNGHLAHLQPRTKTRGLPRATQP